MMPTETWVPRKLNKLGFVGRGKSKHRPRNEPSLYGGKYPFVQTSDIKAAELYLREYTQTYNDKGLAQSKLWRPGTLCITIAANIAETAILGMEACFPDSVVGFVANEEESDVRFIKYYIDTIKLRMQSISRGTTQDNLSLEKLHTFDILTPPLPIQRKIADVLSTYDDLIEVNSRRISILEQMAQSVYREWFGKVNAQSLPEGWKEIEVKEIIQRLPKGQVYEKADVIEKGDVVVIDQSRGELLGFHNNKADFDARPSEPIAIFGDHTCKMQLMVRSFSIGPNVVPFTSKQSYPIHYVFSVVNGLVETKEYKRHWNDLVAKKIALPPKELANKYAGLIEPMLAEQDLLRRKNANLRRTRDLLLPRLVSGKIELQLEL